MHAAVDEEKCHEKECHGNVPLSFNTTNTTHESPKIFHFHVHLFIVHSVSMDIIIRLDSCIRYTAGSLPGSFPENFR